MTIATKWTILALVHLAVLTCLTLGVILIGLRMGGHLETTPKEAAALLATIPPSDAEIARLHILTARINVMQNNLSNAETVAFKRQRVYVEEGIEPKIAACQLDLSQGPLETTNGNLDLAIQGEGFFHIKVQPTLADGTAYTRTGMLQQNRNGDLVVALGDGYVLIPNINIPSGAVHVTVGQDGMVTYLPSSGTKIVNAGQITLSRFTNAQGLSKTVEGLFTETVESGPPLLGAPGESGMGQVLQGYLENSNVDTVKEWAALLHAQQMLQFINPATQVGSQAGPASLKLEKSIKSKDAGF